MEENPKWTAQERASRWQLLVPKVPVPALLSTRAGVSDPGLWTVPSMLLEAGNGETGRSELSLAWPLLPEAREEGFLPG